MNRVGIKALEERIEKMRAELGSLADECAVIEKERDESLSKQDQVISAAKVAAHGLLDMQMQTVNKAEGLRQKGNALISSGKKLLTEADQLRLVATDMDLGMESVRDAEHVRRELEAHWKDELAKKQDSKTRRKRAQLASAIEKLEKRMARKAAEPEMRTGSVPVIPPNTGTPEPARDPNLLKSMLEHPLETAALLVGNKIAKVEKTTASAETAPEIEKS